MTDERKLELLTGLKHDGQFYPAGTLLAAEELDADTTAALLIEGSARVPDDQAEEVATDLLEQLRAENAELREQLASRQRRRAPTRAPEPESTDGTGESGGE